MKRSRFNWKTATPDERKILQDAIEAIVDSKRTTLRSKAVLRTEISRLDILMKRDDRAAKHT